MNVFIYLIKKNDAEVIVGCHFLLINVWSVSLGYIPCVLRVSNMCVCVCVSLVIKEHTTDTLHFYDTENNINNCLGKVIKSIRFCHFLA